MFSQRKTMKFTADYFDNIRRLKQKIVTADAIVIGAGAGLSTAAGFTYSGERFENIFQILSRNTVLAICIPVDFSPLNRRKNIGRTGRDIFTSIAIWTLITALIKHSFPS